MLNIKAGDAYIVEGDSHRCDESWRDLDPGFEHQRKLVSDRAGGSETWNVTQGNKWTQPGNYKRFIIFQ